MGKWKRAMEKDAARDGVSYPGAPAPSQILAIVEAIEGLGEHLVPTPDPGTTPPPGVAVLWVWTGRLDEVKSGLNIMLDTLYRDGKIGDHPDGGSQGWEWRTP